MNKIIINLKILSLAATVKRAKILNKNINYKIIIEILLFNKQNNMIKKNNQILINNNIFKC